MKPHRSALRSLRARPKSAIAVLVLIGLAVTAAFVARRQQRRPRPAHHRGHARPVRRRARDPRRHPAPQVDRAVGADAVGRAADRQAREERLARQGRRRRGRVRRLHAAPDDAGEAVGAEAGGSGDRAVDGAVAHHAGAERHRADALEVQHPAREARPEQGRHRLADRERAGQADARATPSRSCTSSRRRSPPT